jgi:hypothetical protein
MTKKEFFAKLDQCEGPFEAHFTSSRGLYSRAYVGHCHVRKLGKGIVSLYRGKFYLQNTRDKHGAEVAAARYNRWIAEHEAAGKDKP